MPKFIAFCIGFIVVSVLTSCAHSRQDTDEIKKFQQQQKEEMAGGVLPKQVLTTPLLTQILQSDLAAQRALPEKSVAQWFAIAQNTQDSRAAKRAALVALEAKQLLAAQKASYLWVQLAPASLTARRLLVSTLLQNNQILPALPHIQWLLSAVPNEIPGFFLQLHLLWGQNAPLSDVLQATEILTTPYPFLPEAQFALAVAKQANQEFDEAKRLLAAALRQSPNFIPAQKLQQVLLQKSTHGQSEHKPISYPAALKRAQEKMQAGDEKGAQHIYKALLASAPDNLLIQYHYGLFLWRQGEVSQAVAQLAAIEAKNPPYVDEIRLRLAQIAEQRQDFKQAVFWYESREEKAPLTVIRCLAKAGKIKMALKKLAMLPQRTAQEKIQYWQGQAQIYALNKQFITAIRLLTQAIRRFPDSADLYYDRALILEQNAQTIAAEVDLRKALALAPLRPTILNGLGYVLVKHNRHVDEADRYINQAQQLAPDDFLIQDSRGWLSYRQGKLLQAEKQLRQAFAHHQDPEMMTHLVEVLWVQQKRDEAKHILRLGLKWYPENALLLQLMQQLGLR